MMRYRAAAISIFLLFTWLAFAYPRAGSALDSPTLEPPQRRAQSSSRRRGNRSPRPAGNPTQRVNYTKFSHATEMHRQECSACHKFPSSNWKEVRKGDAAFADITEYPEHDSCLKCHYQQFFARERPAPRICSVCHVAITPRQTARHPFPNPPEIFNASKGALSFVSDFRISFPHETHLELVGENVAPGELNGGVRFALAALRTGTRQEAADKSCAFCHQTYQPQGKSDDEFMTARPKTLPEDAFWLKKGTFKSTPNHATCFTCHTPEGDMKPASTDCATCHKLAPAQAKLGRTDFDPKAAAALAVTDGTALSKWRRRASSATFRHEGGMHPEQSCSTCHTIAGMNTLDDKTLKVQVTSCDACHIGASADEGVLNFEIEKRKTDPAFQCVKCHMAFGKEPVPESHLKAAKVK